MDKPYKVGDVISPEEIDGEENFPWKQKYKVISTPDDIRSADVGTRVLQEDMHLYGVCIRTEFVTVTYEGHTPPVLVLVSYNAD